LSSAAACVCLTALGSLCFGRRLSLRKYAITSLANALTEQSGHEERLKADISAAVPPSTTPPPPSTDSLPPATTPDPAAALAHISHRVADIFLDVVVPLMFAVIRPSDALHVRIPLPISPQGAKAQPVLDMDLDTRNRLLSFQQAFFRFSAVLSDADFSRVLLSLVSMLVLCCLEKPSAAHPAEFVCLCSASPYPCHSPPSSSFLAPLDPIFR
jgi:hypothetical protein